MDGRTNNLLKIIGIDNCSDAEKTYPCEFELFVLSIG